MRVVHFFIILGLGCSVNSFSEDLTEKSEEQQLSDFLNEKKEEEADESGETKSFGFIGAKKYEGSVKSEKVPCKQGQKEYTIPKKHLAKLAGVSDINKLFKINYPVDSYAPVQISFPHSLNIPRRCAALIDLAVAPVDKEVEGGKSRHYLIVEMRIRPFLDKKKTFPLTYKDFLYCLNNPRDFIEKSQRAMLEATQDEVARNKAYAKDLPKILKGSGTFRQKWERYLTRKVPTHFVSVNLDQVVKVFGKGKEMREIVYAQDIDFKLTDEQNTLIERSPLHCRNFVTISKDKKRRKYFVHADQRFRNELYKKCIAGRLSAQQALVLLEKRFTEKDDFKKIQRILSKSITKFTIRDLEKWNARIKEMASKKQKLSKSELAELSSLLKDVDAMVEKGLTQIAKLDGQKFFYKAPKTPISKKRKAKEYIDDMTKLIYAKRIEESLTRLLNDAGHITVATKVNALFRKINKANVEWDKMEVREGTGKNLAKNVRNFAANDAKKLEEQRRRLQKDIDEQEEAYNSGGSFHLSSHYFAKAQEAEGLTGRRFSFTRSLITRARQSCLQAQMSGDYRSQLACQRANAQLSAQMNRARRLQERGQFLAQIEESGLAARELERQKIGYDTLDDLNDEPENFRPNRYTSSSRYSSGRWNNNPYDRHLHERGNFRGNRYTGPPQYGSGYWDNRAYRDNFTMANPYMLARRHNHIMHDPRNFRGTSGFFHGPGGPYRSGPLPPGSLNPGFIATPYFGQQAYGPMGPWDYGRTYYGP